MNDSMAAKNLYSFDIGKIQLLHKFLIRNLLPSKKAVMITVIMKPQSCTCYNNVLMPYYFLRSTMSFDEERGYKKIRNKVFLYA